jgi:acetoin utilization protein AcuB
MHARDIMTARPVTATPEMTLDRAATLLRRNRFRHLPVVDSGRLVGVVSDRDLQRAAAGGMRGDEAIRPLIHGPAITATPDSPVEHVARLLQENKIGCVPIVTMDDSGEDGHGELVGIVTESDVFSAMMRAMGMMEPGSRVVVRLHETAEDLLAAALVLYQQGVPVLSLHTEPAAATTEGGLHLVVRLGTINPLPVVSALIQQGLEVVYPEAPGQATCCPRLSPGSAGAVSAAVSAAVGSRV